MEEGEMINIVSRAGMIALASALLVVSGAALVDGIRNRATIATLEGVIDNQSKALKLEQENLGTCHANYRLVELALDRQGKDIRSLNDSTKAAGKRAEEAAKEGRAAREAAQQAVKGVQGLPRPAPAMACTEAARLLRGGM